ncbi:MAG: hypothetical protein PWQ55_272 [Chloroflexota bacterium]|nr:hypothetical protein [Chloroflexota bacterium]
MNKPIQIKKELLKVDAQAGLLRLVLCIISLFIAWSLLAYLSATIDPLPSLPDFLPSSSGNAANLAADLWRDVLGNYFSSFTLLNLALLFCLCAAAFEGAVLLFSQALHLDERRSALRFLWSCLFSLRDYPLLDTGNPDYQKTDTWKILSGIGGPGYLYLEADTRILLTDHNGYAQYAKPANEEEDFVFLPPGHKALLILPDHSLPFHLKLRAINKSGMTVDWRNLRLRCQLALPQDEAEPQTGRKSTTALLGLADASGQAWEKQLEGLLCAEIRSFLLSCSTADIRRVFKLERPAKHTAPAPKPTSRRAHRVAHHARLYATPGRFFQWQNQSGFLRHRRRSLLPELRVRPMREETPAPPELDFNSEMREYLSQTFKTIYNIPIDIEIENIGEIQLNGEN